MAQKFIRARGAEQVEIRRNEILNAAKKLYKERFFDDINILSIAKESGFTRSNIYRYFASKEEVYLSLITNDLGSWVGHTEKWLKQRYTPPEFAEQWVDKTLTQKRLLGLLSILSTKLEPNGRGER
jgi:AcrR family transcriptional regulator